MSLALEQQWGTCLTLLVSRVVLCCAVLQALLPREQENVGQLHARYTKALLRLAKQHGVKLNIVE